MAHDELPTRHANLPSLPADHADFIGHVATHQQTPIPELLEPYLCYETELRKIFADSPNRACAVEENNIVPVFDGQEQNLRIRARDLDSETDDQKEAYLLPLSRESRKPDGSPAVVSSLIEFKTNLSIFCERSHEDLDWSNVIIAGGAVATCLMPVPLSHSKSSASLRSYYHDLRAPATDVDLYLYGVSEDDAVAKLKQIEASVRGICLLDTTTIRTKNAVVIASQYPVRHVTIHLRIYRSISEVLSTFDVDSACVAYDGEQVWASPRGLAAWMTQVNTVDHRRSSPYHEDRLVKYRSLDFEVRFPDLDRARIDPRVYQRDLFATDGLARLLLLEHLSTRARSATQNALHEAERGLPQRHRALLKLRQDRGDHKAKEPRNVAEWVDANARSIPHTFTIPYGPGISPSDIEDMLDKEDRLLNARAKKRKHKKAKIDETKLHRHTAFYGSIEDVIGDCCDGCPAPSTSNGEDAARQDSECFVSGRIEFYKIGLPRQTTEVTHPRTREQYVQPAYVDITEPICRAIVDGNLPFVQSWLGQDGNNVNSRDINNRTPLHLASKCSTVEVVRCLLQHGARIAARTNDGKAAIHIACIRGDVGIVSALLKQNEENKAHYNTEDGSLGTLHHDADNHDINLALSQHDTLISPLHLAIMYDNPSVVKFLVQNYGADINKSLNIVQACRNRGDDWYHGIEQYLPPLALALRLPLTAAQQMTRFLFELGASSHQMVNEQVTVLQSCIASKPSLLDTYFEADADGARSVIAAVMARRTGDGCIVSSPLLTAIESRNTDVALRLLEIGAKGVFTYEDLSQVLATNIDFLTAVTQPVILAVENELPILAAALVSQYGADLDSVTPTGWKAVHKQTIPEGQIPESLLDCVQKRIERLTVEPMRENVFYLQDHEKGSYSYYSYDIRLDRERERFEKYHSMPKRESASPPHIPGRKEKIAAVEDMLDDFLTLRAALLSRSARSFHELHPHLEVHAKPSTSDNVSNAARRRTWEPEPKHTFRIPRGRSYDTPSSYYPDGPGNYVNLFEAVWRGDIESVKRLTLLPGHNAEGKSCPPLSIAVADEHGDSPYTIALSLGHVELTKTIFWIAEAQYMPLTSSDRKRCASDSDEDSDDNADEDSEESDYEYSDDAEEDDDDFELESTDDESSPAGSSDRRSEKRLAAKLRVLRREELAIILKDDEISNEDVWQVEKSVGSPIPPALMFTWPCPKTVKRQNQDTGSGNYGRQDIRPRNMTAMALWRNDLAMLSCILDLANKPTKTVIGEDRKELKHGGSLAVDDHAFRVALQSASPSTLAFLIQRTAAGIPLDTLAAESIVQITVDETGKYRGLKTSRARKRTASKNAEPKGPKLSKRISPPFLLAANFGSLKNIRWLLSDAPIKHYMQFAADKPEDERVKRISGSSAGFKRTVVRFLKSRSKLAILYCMMSKFESEGLEVLKYLVDTMPEAVNARSSAGDTPLLVAYRTQNLEAAKVLIEAGADQTAHDCNGGNVLHSLAELMRDTGGGNGSWYTPPPANEKHYAHMRAMMDLLDKSLIPMLSTQRHLFCRSYWYTPLASWLHHVMTPNSFLVSVARVMLEYSKGVELDMFDSEGGTALHLLVEKNTPPTHLDFYGLAALLLEYRPDVLHKENTRGTTPLELAQNGALRAMCLGRYTQKKHGEQDWRKYDLGFSIAYTPEPSFTEEHRFDSDDLGGKEMAQLLLSGAVKPSSSPGQRIMSLLRLLTEIDATVVAAGKGKRVLTTSSDIVAVIDMAGTENHKKAPQKHDGQLPETTQWLRYGGAKSLLRAQFPGCPCAFCAHRTHYAGIRIEPL
ncbi:hypothetical protein Q7P37_010954 [Cladosporium fusiforme]